MYWNIAVKLIVGMCGVLLFLRISGKTQMAQLTPLDTVNAFVMGALVGGVIYSPDTPVWVMLFSLALWTSVNLMLRYLMRFKSLRRLIKGDTVLIVCKGAINLHAFRRNGLEMEQFRTMLRENGIFSMFDVQDVRFEPNGKLTVSRPSHLSESYLLVNGGVIVCEALEQAGKDEKWLRQRLRKLGYRDLERLFCVEWTPGKGLYVSSLDDADGAHGHLIEEAEISN